MPELLRESVVLGKIGRWCGNDCRVVLRHKLLVGVIGALLGAPLQGCAADKPPSQGETNLANAAKDVTIPLEAGKKQNPVPDTAEVVSQGQEVFLGSCAQCHGADGRADTDIGRSMAPPAMDLSSSHVQHWSDAELFWIVQNGVRLTGDARLAVDYFRKRHLEAYALHPSRRLPDGTFDKLGAAVY